MVGYIFFLDNHCENFADTILKALMYCRCVPSFIKKKKNCFRILIVLGFVGHFVLSPREREKRDRRDSRGDEREGQGRRRKMNESEETEEVKTFPLYPHLLQG